MDTWREEQLRRSWEGVCSGWFFGPLITWNGILEQILPATAPDIVMMEHTRHSASLDTVRRLRPEALLVVNSHNVESYLVRQIMPESFTVPRRQMMVRRLEDYERELNQRCDVLWSCSLADQERYRQLGITRPACGVVPNGVDTHSTPFMETMPRSGNPQILFTGTLCYEPNINGVHWFHREVWPILKGMVSQVRWQIIGRAPSHSIRELADNDNAINVAADVPSVQPYLNEAHVGICPLFAGSGTRLKILEAFSAGLPMVSTRLGAEGIDAVPFEHILIEDDPANFASAIAWLLRNPWEAHLIRQNARRLAVEKYDWSSITDLASTQLNDELRRKRPAGQRQQPSRLVGA
jgi:glycosyltransferase involved in cell wall biosynthesis